LRCEKVLGVVTFRELKALGGVTLGAVTFRELKVLGVVTFRELKEIGVEMFVRRVEGTRKLRKVEIMEKPAVLLYPRGGFIGQMRSRAHQPFPAHEHVRMTRGFMSLDTRRAFFVL
jgi:hypothetical protein